ncbi:MAG: hypothetical protein ACW9WZ_03575 [Nitrosopumilus sp.]|jgi:hypothetical protein
MSNHSQKNHNKHLDMLQEYKIYLRNIVLSLEKMDQTSEFAKQWNAQTIKERKEEILMIDKIIKNLIRF